ncbi:MAG: hypothetical protein M1819_002400 [Sarea resinae]|nr:MAG: hypothetical protein M1819_002400 [Sarea resinae]
MPSQGDTPESYAARLRAMLQFREATLALPGSTADLPLPMRITALEADVAMLQAIVLALQGQVRVLTDAAQEAAPRMQHSGEVRAQRPLSPSPPPPPYRADPPSAPTTVPAPIVTASAPSQSALPQPPPPPTRANASPTLATIRAPPITASATGPNMSPRSNENGARRPGGSVGRSGSTLPERPRWRF